MKVFISWSGPVSKRLGEVVRDWLPGVLQAVEPYFTPEDIEKGGRWSNDIAEELAHAEIGILCVTRDNLHSDWLLFEAGALSKSLEKSYVCPVLFGISNADLAGPLKQFQTTELSKQDFHKLISVINNKLGERKLASKTLDRAFDVWWPELEAKMLGILEGVTIVDGPVRPDRDILEEILLLTRGVSKQPRSTLPSGVIVDLLEGFIALHELEANEVGSYAEALEVLQQMAKPVRYLGRKYGGSNSKSEELFDKFESLSYLLLSDRLSLEQEDDL